MDYCVGDKAGSNDAQMNVQLTKLTPLQPLQARHTRDDVPLSMSAEVPMD